MVTARSRASKSGRRVFHEASRSPCRASRLQRLLWTGFSPVAFRDFRQAEKFPLGPHGASRRPARNRLGRTFPGWNTFHRPGRSHSCQPCYHTEAILRLALPFPPPAVIRLPSVRSALFVVMLITPFRVFAPHTVPHRAADHFDTLDVFQRHVVRPPKHSRENRVIHAAAVDQDQHFIGIHGVEC